MPPPAGRLARLDRISPDDRQQLADVAEGVDLGDIVRMLTHAVDVAWQRAAAANGGADPDDAQLADARSDLIEQASRAVGACTLPVWSCGTEVWRLTAMWSTPRCATWWLER